MLITIKNIIGSIRNVLGVVTDNLKMWLPFESIEIVSSVQVAPDTSGNSNNATLYTGKTLSFDGINDYVDCGNIGVSLKTLAFWINLDSTTEKVLQVTSSQSVEVSSGTITLNGTWTGSTIYVDATATSTILASSYKRVVITTTSAITVDDLELGRIGSSYGDFILSDLEIYDTPWTQADVTYDYNKPNHLVTDNPSTSISLSNLKGYWALSEGAGDFVYNSAVALGSEEVDKGDFAGITQAESTTGADWITGAEWTINGGKAHKASGTVTYLQQPLALPSNKSYVATYRVSNYSGSNDVKFGFSGALTFWGTPRYADGVYTEVFFTLSNTTNLRFRANASFVGSISEITIKEISVGSIIGATGSFRQATIPQLGLMDWSKSTIGSDEITLISNPNNPSQDILGNSVRLREHSLNLDGSGYAKVDSDSSLDIANYSIDGWVYNTNNSSTSEAILTKVTQENFEVYIRTSQLRYYNSTDGKKLLSTITLNAWTYFCITESSGTLKCYINDDSTPRSSQTVTQKFANSGPVYIGSNQSGDYSNALIDDIRVYNRVLSADEVLQNYNAGLSKHQLGSDFSDDFSGDYGN